VPAGALVVSSAELTALKQQLGVLIGMQRELAAQQGELAAQLTAGTEQIRTGKTAGRGYLWSFGTKPGQLRTRKTTLQS
jgi:hypothetical protein